MASWEQLNNTKGRKKVHRKGCSQQVLEASFVVEEVSFQGSRHHCRLVHIQGGKVLDTNGAMV